MWSMREDFHLKNLAYAGHCKKKGAAFLPPLQLKKDSQTESVKLGRCLGFIRNSLGSRGCCRSVEVVEEDPLPYDDHESAP